jgi:hypothetical protein
MMPLLGCFRTDSFLEMHGTTKGLAVATLMWSHIWSATFRLGDMSAAALVAVPQNTPERDGLARIIPHKVGGGNASRAVTRLVVGVQYKSAKVLGKEESFSKHKEFGRHASGKERSKPSNTEESSRALSKKIDG